jgi:L-alanine-DL-glutamate epimerase-like enolase superfamily enzyme
MYFEQPVPYTSHEAFCDTPIRTENGAVIAPSGAGLGIKMDWKQIREQAFWHYKIGGE